MSKLPVFIILDIDNTLLSTCRRFSPSYPFTALHTEQVSLRYYDFERSHNVDHRILTLRPHLSDFLRVLSSELSSSRVDVRVGLFTRNTDSYARAVAAGVICPRLASPLALCCGSSRCVGDRRDNSNNCNSINSNSNSDNDNDNNGNNKNNINNKRKKTLSVTGHAATSLLLDDNCLSFVPEEFFSGARPWSPDDELDEVLSCDRRMEEITGEVVPLCALVEGFVEFWHCHGGDIGSSCSSDEGKVNLLEDIRAASYRRRWYKYHEPMEEQLHCIM